MPLSPRQKPSGKPRRGGRSAGAGAPVARPKARAGSSKGAGLVEHVLARLKRPGANVLKVLHASRRGKFAAQWQREPALYRAFTRRLIWADHPTRAVELADQGLERFEGDAELRVLKALALRRGGNVSPATEEGIKAVLDEAGLPAPLRGEALSLMGAIYKVRFQQARAPASRAALAEASALYYERAHAECGDPYPLLNAATMSLMAGRETKAHDFARRVAGAVQGPAGTPTGCKDYWLLATLAEARLILGEQAAAADWYRRALAGAPGKPASLANVASTKANMLLLRRKARVGREILRLFDVGRVVVFAGHMIDHPGRAAAGKPPRFPPGPALESAVAGAIRRQLDALNARVGYCSVACGADVLFAEELLRRGADLHVVLPYARDDFYQTSVDFDLPAMARWRERADALMARAQEVHYATTENFLGDTVLLEFVTTFAQGLAITHASRLEAEPAALAVVDWSSRKLAGGTRYFVEQWRAGGRALETIDLAALREEAGVDAARTPAPPASPAPRAASRVPAAAQVAREALTAGHPASPLKSLKKFHRELKVMLFADVHNFSKLDEKQSPTFLVRFLNGVAGALRPFKSVFSNTWGDGLYVVFERVGEAAAFAARLLEVMEKGLWDDLKLPHAPTLRVALHAGPVYSALDRIIGRKNYFGSHVNRAARIEPVTMLGCAYASEQFAASLAVEPGHGFVCRFVGTETLPKENGDCPLYRLDRR